MRGVYQAGALAALSLGLGTVPFAVGCWGDEFTAAPPVGGIGGAAPDGLAAGPSVGAGAVGGTEQATSTGGLREGCTAVLPADADTYLDGMFADDNYDKKALSEDELEIYQFGVTSRRILIFFDVASWLRDYDVTRARLELVLADVPDSFGTIDVHKILLPETAGLPGWDERFVTWNRYTAEALWTTPGGDFVPTASASAPMEADWPVGTVVGWDVSQDVKEFHAGGPNYGWLLKETNDPVDGLGLGYVFYGRESEVVLMDPEDPVDDTEPDAGTEPGDPGSQPAPDIPDTTTGDTTGDASTTDSSTTDSSTSESSTGDASTTSGGAGGSMGIVDAGTPDAEMEDEGLGVTPRLLVDICPP